MVAVLAHGSRVVGLVHTPPLALCAHPWKKFVSLIVGCCLPKGEVQAPRLLCTIATASAIWLGTLSRSHSRRAHRGEGGGQSR